MIEILGYRFEKRERPNRAWQIAMTLAALAVAVLITGVLIISSGANFGKAISGLLQGAFGSWKAVLETLVKATPLILTSIAVTIAFRGNIMNIGAEGQLYTGAMAGYWVAASFPEMNPTLHIILIVLAGFAGGALCGVIPGLLKGLLNVDETIVTVMMNYVVAYVLSFFLSGVWQAPGQYYYISAPVPEAVYYPLLIPNSRLHIGFVFAIVATIVAYWLLQKTRLGYEIRTIGLNTTAAKFKGINVARVIIVTMLISGGIAGLAGVGEVVGLHHRLRLDISSGYGFTGIIIALLGGLNPFAVFGAAILMGGLINGSNAMQIFSHVPSALVDALQAIVLICLLAFQVLANYNIRKVKVDN
ncbi:MAG: ABC transporter permease [Anaerolineaceae bacterium]